MTVSAATDISEDGRPAGVFVLGRQHSGNTVLTLLMGRMAGCFHAPEEDIILEHAARLDAMPNAGERARWIGAHLNLDDADLEGRVAEALAEWAAEHPAARTAELFQESMALATRATGNAFWAKKATSYIFHAATVLREMPRVKLVYLMRNPFDVCASKKRRDPNDERVLGWGMSWNRGVLFASRYARSHPDRFHIMRYEELVDAPERTVRSLCAFLGTPYSDSLLDVPHFNPSENRYKPLEGVSGFNRSRLHYYMDQLDPAEIAAMELVTNPKLRQQHYPDLPHLAAPLPMTARIRGAGIVAAGFVRYPLGVLSRLRAANMPIRDYLIRRVRAGLGGG